jgi:Ca2+-binding EF-hand superfamily protein
MSSRYLLHAEDFLRDVQLPIDTKKALEHDLKEHVDELFHTEEKNNLADKLRAIQSDIMGLNEDDEDLEMLYYWFAIHDEDGNGELDGNELLHAFSHWSNDHEEPSPATYRNMLSAMTDMVDHIMKEDDLNGDGYISIEEFMQSGH